MKKKDRFTSLFWIAFGLYIAFEGFRLELGTFQNPGCGFLVFGAGTILFLLGGILFIQTFLVKNEERRETLWRGVDWFKAVKVVVSLFIYAFVLKWLGFILSTFLLLIFLFQGLESQKWRVTIFFSVVSVAVCYVVFGILFEFQFPQGIFERILGQLF